MSNRYLSSGCRGGMITGRCRKQRWMMYRRNSFEGKLEGLDDYRCCELTYREFTGSLVAVGGSRDEGRLN